VVTTLPAASLNLAIAPGIPQSGDVISPIDNTLRNGDNGHVTYPGGKNGSGVYQTIINQMPPHHIYIEAFLGGGAILRMKRHAAASIGIDSDEHVLAGWRGDEVPNLTLLCTNALEFLGSNTFSDDTLIYLDPPYLMATRSCKRPIYRHEFTTKQHADLLHIIARGPAH
jgi:site-specific DNA-adenine methylase